MSAVIRTAERNVRSARSGFARTRPARMSEVARENALLGAAGVLTALALWEIAPRVGAVNQEYLPPFSEVVNTLGQLGGTSAFWIAVGQTLVTWGTGLTLAVTGGLIVGLTLGLAPIARRFTAPVVEFLRPIPSVALIPLAVLMLGTGMPSTVMLVVYAAFWQVLIQVMYGVIDVDPVQRDLSRSYRFRRRTFLARVVMPTVLPYGLTGLRLAAAVALVLTITGELVIGTPGIGQQIALSRSSNNTPVMYGYVLVAGVLGVLVNLGARQLEKRFLGWHPSIRVAAT